MEPSFHSRAHSLNRPPQMTDKMIKTFADPLFAWVASISATLVGLFTNMDIVATLPSVAIAFISIFFFVKKKVREDRHRRFLIEEKEKRIREGLPFSEWADDALDE